MSLDAARTVRELATELPNATRVFEKFGIDYCCGGGKSLADACKTRNVAVSDVVSALEQGLAAPQTASEAEFSAMGLKELVEHIVSRHHGYVKQEIPRLQQLLKKVESVHGQNHPELAQIRSTFAALSAELLSHMMKEEQILFPYITEVGNAAASNQRLPRAPFGTVKNPVRMMEMEHDSAGRALEEIQTATSSYTPPEDACFSYRTLYAALKEFEADLHQHIHLENNILFPKTIALEEQGEQAHVLA